MSNNHRYPPRGPAPAPTRLVDRPYWRLALGLYCLLSVVVTVWSLGDRIKTQLRVYQIEEQLATCQRDAATIREGGLDPTR